MTGIAIDMTVFPCRIVWDKAVTGVTRLTQNVASNYRTELGSDAVVARGNSLQEVVRTNGMYDSLNAQHALNFATIDTSSFVRTVETSDDPAETLGQFRATVAGSTGRRLQVDLTVTNSLGQTAVMPVRITQ